MERWRVALTYRIGSERTDEEHVINDLASISDIISRGPADWGTAYLCVTELVPTPEPADETPGSEESAV